MCAQTRPWFILSSGRVLGNGVQTHVNSKEKNPLYRKLRGLNPQRYITQDCEPNILPTELFHLNTIDPKTGTVMATLSDDSHYGSVIRLAGLVSIYCFMSSSTFHLQSLSTVAHEIVQTDTSQNHPLHVAGTLSNKQKFVNHLLWVQL